MKKVFIFIIVLICFIQIHTTAFAENSNFISSNEIKFKDTTIFIDQPASLDAYIICYDNNNNELWHTKLFSYDFITGISMEAQKVDIKSIMVENDLVKIVDSREVIYSIDPTNGKILNIDNTNYILPDFSNVSSSQPDNNNGGFIKYLAIFFAFIGVGIIIYVASRNKK